MEDKDLIQSRFGQLTVLKKAPKDKWGKECYLCQCSCGQEVIVRGQQLKSGKVKSCGCLRKKAPLNKLDLTGKRFGKLTVLYPAFKKRYWHCKCECGNELDVYSQSLLNGKTQSCGCQRKETSSRMHEHLHYQDDTCYEILKNALKDTNKNQNGFRGLYRLKCGKYRSSITFQGRHYNLGHYLSLEKAVAARLRAEEVLHKGYIKAFEAYHEKALKDPLWALDHPFFYNVTYQDGNFNINTVIIDE